MRKRLTQDVSRRCLHAHDECGHSTVAGDRAAMRTERPRCEPSPYRIFALLLANFGSLVEAAAAGRSSLRDHLAAFVAALWREGVNPSPGRPYARERHLATAAEK